MNLMKFARAIAYALGAGREFDAEQKRTEGMTIEERRARAKESLRQLHKLISKCQTCGDTGTVRIQLAGEISIVKCPDCVVNR